MKKPWKPLPLRLRAEHRIEDEELLRRQIAGLEPLKIGVPEVSPSTEEKPYVPWTKKKAPKITTTIRDKAIAFSMRLKKLKRILNDAAYVKQELEAHLLPPHPKHKKRAPP